MNKNDPTRLTCWLDRTQSFCTKMFIVGGFQFLLSSKHQGRGFKFLPCSKTRVGSWTRPCCGCDQSTPRISYFFHYPRLYNHFKCRFLCRHRAVFARCFHSIARENYPILWKEVKETGTIMPTTVCCDQSICVVIHSLHTPTWKWNGCCNCDIEVSWKGKEIV